MGSPYHHYLIADGYIIPPENEIFYSEKVLRIPCNQPIDRKRRISPRTPTRAEVGLPEDVFVYGSLNGMQKLTANGFSRWMEILREVPDSVLWLLSGEAETEQAPASRGGANAASRPSASSSRGKAANPHHLARIALADLFLDTLALRRAFDGRRRPDHGPADPDPGGAQLCRRGSAAASFRRPASTISSARRPRITCGAPIAFGRDRASLAPLSRQAEPGARDERPARHSRADAQPRRGCSGGCRARANAARRRFRI